MLLIMEKITHTNTAAAIHLTSLLQYCIPFGNFIFPIIIWSSSRDKSEFVDAQGKQVINFQLSLFIYSLLIVAILVPIFIYSIFSVGNATYNSNELFEGTLNFAQLSGTIIIAIVLTTFFIILKIVEFLLIIYAAVKVSQGINYKYPLTINFIK